MPATVYDDDIPELAGTPDYHCRACGMGVRSVVAFDGYGQGWQACFACIVDAYDAIREARRRKGQEPEGE